MANVYLKKKISSRIVTGHPWIFSNEVEKTDTGISDGEIVDVIGSDKKFVGRGYINSKSRILVRLLTRNSGEEINESFFSTKDPAMPGLQE